MLAFVRLFSYVGICICSTLYVDILCWHLSDYFSPMLAFVRLCMLTFVRILDVGICPTTFLLCWHLSDLAFVRILDVGICPTTFLLCWHLSDYFSPMLAFVRLLFSYVGICPTLYVDICPNFRCWHLSDYFSPMLAFVRLLYVDCPMFSYVAFVRLLFSYVGICPTTFLLCWHLSMLAFVRLLFSYVGICPTLYVDICPNFRCWHLSDYFSPMLAFVRLGICPTLSDYC